MEFPEFGDYICAPVASIQLSNPSNFCLIKSIDGTQLFCGVENVKGFLNQLFSSGKDSGIIFVVGKICTGKTICARYVIPHLLWERWNLQPDIFLYLDMLQLDISSSCAEDRISALYQLTKNCCLHQLPDSWNFSRDLNDIPLLQFFKILPHSAIIVIDNFELLFIGMEDNQISKLVCFLDELFDSSCQFIITGSIFLPWILNNKQQIPKFIKNSAIFECLEEEELSQLKDTQRLLRYYWGVSKWDLRKLAQNLKYLHCGKLIQCSRYIEENIDQVLSERIQSRLLLVQSKGNSNLLVTLGNYLNGFSKKPFGKFSNFIVEKKGQLFQLKDNHLMDLLITISKPNIVT